MSSNDNDSCIITKLDFNAERITRILERRFKSNSSYVSFDYKSYRPERPAINSKKPRSFLRFMPKKDENEDNDYEIISSSSSSSSSSFSTPASSEAEEEEEVDDDEHQKQQQQNIHRRKTSKSFDNDYLEVLADWKPGTFRGIPENDQSNDDDEDEHENIFQSIQSSDSADGSPVENMDHSAEILISPVEDLMVTFEHRPVKVKKEPLVRNLDPVPNIFQLDGQVDVISRPISNVKEKSVTKNDAHLDELVAKIKANAPKHQGPVRLHVVPPRAKRKRREHVRKVKPIVDQPRKPPSPTKENTEKPKKRSKKFKPPLYQLVMKLNGDAIRAECPYVHPTFNTAKKSNDRISISTHKNISSKPQAAPTFRHSFSESPSSSPMKITDPSPSTSLNREKSVPVHLNSVTKKAEKSKSNLSKTPQMNKTPLPSSRSIMKIPKLSDKKRDSSNILQPRKLQLDRTNSSIERALGIEVTQVKKIKTKELKRLTSEKVDLLARRTSINDVKTKKNKAKKSSVVPMEIESVKDDRNRLSTIVRSSSPECIVIDDDDENEIEEIKKQSRSISYNIRIREEHLAHTVRSSKMRTQWLINLEYLLLEHILICHDEMKTSNFYSINPKFICSIVETFVKKFLLSNASNDEEDFSLFQFSLTSHLRYFLHDLPTTKHSDDDEFCSICSTLNSSINDLFDFIFDLIEIDLCETKEKNTFSSSWFNNEYFPKIYQTKSTGKCSTYRLKLVIYFIELISIHTRKCSKRKNFQMKINAKKIFRIFEDSISNLFHRNSIDDLDERLALCLNIVELTLLFLDEKQQRIDEFSKFLTKFVEKNPRALKMILLNKHLLVDIRLAIVNRLAKKKFQSEIFTMKNLNEFFEKLNTIDLNDESTLIFLRAFFETFADFILETSNNSIIIDRFNKQLHQIFMKILQISQTNKSLTKMVVLFRLLRCRWNHL